MLEWKQLLPKEWPQCLSSYIKGGFRHVLGAKTFPIVFSAEQVELAQFSSANQEIVDSAVDAAQEAQKVWRKFSPVEKSRVLMKISNELQRRNEELSRLETLDTSRVISETSEVDIVSCRDAFEYFASVAHLVTGQHIPLSNGSFGYTVREPLGVCAGIGAWNYPMQGMAFKVAPALAAGNGFIFKPSEETVLTALCLVDIIERSGVPSGLVNVVLGGGDVGAMLASHPKVAKVSFTGSLRTGALIMKTAAESDYKRVVELSSDHRRGHADTARLKHITMELGGKSPLIIFEDADINKAVSGAMLANFYSNGEVCSNGTRVFVHKKIKEEFTKELVRRTKLLKVGHPFDKSVQISSLISTAHLRKVKTYIDIGVKEGAKLVLGGEVMETLSVDGKTFHGAYVAPTIFDQCQDGFQICREEIFGPVMCLLEFEEYEEVIRRANNTIFGLAGGVFTKNIQLAHRAMSDLEAGVVYVNNYNLAPVELPWGGHKLSGVGRENGLEAVYHYMQTKSVFVEMNDIFCPYK